MRLAYLTPAAGALAILLSSCGNTNTGSGGATVSTGPFDRSGRYREDWADDPSKWQKSGGSPSPHEMKSDEIPQIAKNDEPPANSNPLPPAESSRTVTVLSQKKPIAKPIAVERKEEVVVKSSKPTSTQPKRTVRKADDDKDRVVKAKPKPKAVVAKAKPKPKPKTVRYIVKKGDSLSAIASRTGSSVSAIKGENGISGTVIRPGQSLVIPKR